MAQRLTQTRMFLSETMLVFIEDIIFFKVVSYLVPSYLLKNFSHYICETHWSIVCWTRSGFPLIYWDSIGMFKLIRENMFSYCLFRIIDKGSFKESPIYFSA